MTLCLFWVASASEKGLDAPKLDQSAIRERFKNMESEAGRQYLKTLGQDAAAGSVALLLFLALGRLRIMTYGEAATWWVAVTAFYAAMRERFW